MSQKKLFVGQKTTRDLITQSAGNPLHSLWLVSDDFVAEVENPQANGFVDVKEIYQYPDKSEKQISAEPGVILDSNGNEIEVTVDNERMDKR